MLDSSDEEQGFFPQVPGVTLQTLPEPELHQHRPTHFQPSQLAHHPPSLSRLPPETLASFTAIPTLQTPEEYRLLSQPRTSTGPAATARERYAEGQGQFQLIYCKYGEESVLNPRGSLGERLFPLGNLFSYEQSQYGLLRQAGIEGPDREGLGRSLQFDSRFESGNLFCVFQSKHETHLYHCLAEQDTNTEGYTQWFYFSLKGTRTNTLYRFLLPNLRKRFSFYREGMRPVLFSLKRQQRTGNGWFYRAYNLSYSQSDLYFTRHGQKVFYYALYFELDFDEQDDWVTVSFAMPYSYSRLIYHLQKCQETARERQVLFHLGTVDYSLSNNQVPEVVVTSPSPQHWQGRAPTNKAGRSEQCQPGRREEWKGCEFSGKKVIVVMARQHPCETNSSFLVEELLYTLARSSNYRVRWLLDTFEFRVYPMVNVDGVIYGNSRCDLAGTDLNRTWKHPLRQLQPQISAIKHTLRQLQQHRTIAYVLDLHSHSHQYNVFSYMFKQEEVCARLFPHLLDRHCPYFHLPSCRLATYTGLETTARAVLSRLIGSLKVSTIETSYFGARKDGKTVPFGPRLFEEIARGLLYALKSYLRKDRLKKEGLQHIRDNIAGLLSEAAREEAHQSDSEPEGDALLDERRLQVLIPSELHRQRIRNRIKMAMLEAEDEWKPGEGERGGSKEGGEYESLAKTERKSQPMDPRDRRKVKLTTGTEESLQKEVRTERKGEYRRYELEGVSKAGNSGRWRSKLKRMRGSNGCGMGVQESSSIQPGLAQPNTDHHHHHTEFRSAMKRLYNSLKGDRKEVRLSKQKTRRDNEFLVRNSGPHFPNHHPNSPQPCRTERRGQSTKVLLRSESKGREGEEEETALGGSRGSHSYVLERSLQQECSRLKLTYSQRYNLNMANLSRMVRRKDRPSFSLQPSFGPSAC